MGSQTKHEKDTEMLWDIFSHVMDFLAEAEEQAVNALSVVVRIVFWSLFWLVCVGLVALFVASFVMK